MKKQNPIINKQSNEDRKIPIKDASKLLGEFFRGTLIELYEEYAYDS